MNIIKNPYKTSQKLSTYEFQVSVKVKIDDKEYIYYVSNFHGGCTLSRLDTSNGETVYAVYGGNVGTLHVRNGELWGGMESSDSCSLIEFNMDNLKVKRRYELPIGTKRIDVLGDTNAGLLLGIFANSDYDLQLVWFDPIKETFTCLAPIPENYQKICYTGKKCEYILLRDSRVERWRIKVSVTEKIETLLEDEMIHDIFTKHQDGKYVLYCVTPTQIYTVSDFM